MTTHLPWQTGLVALLFAAAFVWGGRGLLLRVLGMDERGAISFGAGMSAAYVFVHVMPEMHGVRAAFAESAPIRLWYEGMAVYYLALIGFLSFYGLDHLRARLRESSEENHEQQSYRIQVGGFAVYAGLVAYLLVHALEAERGSLAAYAVAMTGHFLAVGHSLLGEHGQRYDRHGRYLLAGLVLTGWAVAQVVALPPHIVALLLAFVSGAVIMNSAIMELPSDKDGRILPFMIGGLVYGAILLPLS
jgi:Kef-type K+ transport system membrane component KefB